MKEKRLRRRWARVSIVLAISGTGCTLFGWLMGPHNDTKGASPLWNPPHKKRPVLNSYGYSRQCVTRRMFRQVPIETCIPLRGRRRSIVDD